MKKLLLFFILCACTTKPDITLQKNLVKPSFDCLTNELNDAEKIICNNEYIARLDINMTTLYKAAYNKTTDETYRKELKESQRNWLKNMRRMTAEADIWQAYSNRIQELKNILGEYVLAIYQYGHRPGELFPPGTSLEAQTESLTDKDGTRYVMMVGDYLECQNDQAELLLTEMQNTSPETPCKQNGNTVECMGYREDITTAVCVPIDFWKSLMPKSSEKCYESYWGEEGGYEYKEIQCSQSHLDLDKDIYKAVEEIQKIKKCKDWSNNSVFVCENEN